MKSELIVPNYHLEDEEKIVLGLLPLIKLDSKTQESIKVRALDYIKKIRSNKSFTIEEFMQQFNLSSQEGIAIICLTEGLLRVPDSLIAKELAFDKLSHKQWASYIIKSKSFRAGLTSIGLYFSGLVSDIANIDNIVTKLSTKCTSPIFLKALKQAIKHLSKEFVFSHDISSSLENIKNFPEYRFAFDILGESTRTMQKAESYYDQYLEAIDIIAQNYRLPSEHLFDRPNLSVKFTALYPRFEFSKKEDIDKYLIPKLVKLVEKIRDNNLAITFDAEEAKRLDIYLYVISKIITHESLKNFEAIGFVVQAYQTRAFKIIDHIINLSKQTNHKIPVRLVKGAYWDSEIKYAQENALEFYPVFTKKTHTDLSYLACAKKMLENEKYIFSQFATHNALTASYIIEYAAGNKNFEFQKLHGMGDLLHKKLIEAGYKVRIYAPIGEMSELLPYLMRRMLENGANSCFIHQVKDKSIASEALVYDLHDHIKENINFKNPILLPKYIYPNRENAMGHSLDYKTEYESIEGKVKAFYNDIYKVASIIDGTELLDKKRFKEHYCPAFIAEKVAEISTSTDKNIREAIEASISGFNKWSNFEVAQRANILRKIADLYEDNKFKLYSILIKEGGKTIRDAVAEVVEAIDFCRYYANQAELLAIPRQMPSPTGEENILTMHPRGLFLCISPWNFPLAIFTGQIVAALVTGNVVVAKPADQTPIIANFATKLMHKAGVPTDVLQLVIVPGKIFGQIALLDQKVAGIVFTGSTSTAKIINMSLAQNANSLIPIIAETGGQNAMIVDSSALFEQVTDDVLLSAFYSAGQRCSALRILYIQEDIYEPLIDMIKNAMETLKIGDPSDFTADIGPVIDQTAFNMLSSHIEAMVSKGFKLIAFHHQKGSAQNGHFFYPHILEISSINDVPEERFGPILHIVKYKANELDKIIDEVNNSGFGLTFGIHSRIEKKIEYITSRIKAGNIYVNRSMIGAKVESQPFGGENKSGTGFKAGGPNYLLRFMTERTITKNLTAIGGNIDLLNQSS